MYQIIYIDIDEEITSVIDKLRKVKTTEVFLAIPKRALILQSIMSLKLLFREAEKTQKRMIVVTQDPQEQKTVEKAGIETRSSLEGLDTDGEMRESVVPKIQEETFADKKAAARKKMQRESLEEIGSNDFYDITGGNKFSDKNELLSSNKPEEKPRRMMDEILREKNIERDWAEVKKNSLPAGQAGMPVAQTVTGSQNFERTAEKEAIMKSFFEPKKYEAEEIIKPKAVSPKQIPVSGKLKKAVFVLFFSGLLVACGAAAYLFLPKAEVKVATKNQSMGKDLNLSGDSKLTEINIQDSVIPARLVEKEATYTFSYLVTGKGTTAGKKSKGVVVIYNEFSSASQSLVATTRLETPDKKIFRLTKGVTVPGTNEVSGKVVPGAIEAEVMADASGEEHNIDSTTFTIPGFAGSPKFEKFSAKSTAKMMGGSATSQGSGVASLTQTDIAMAKSKAEAEAKTKIKADLKNEIPIGEYFSESVTEETVLESGALSKARDAVAEFQYRVKIKAQTMVFSEVDVKKMFLSAFKIPDNTENQNNVSLDYGAVSGDFGSEKMNIKVHGKSNIGVELDVEKFKKDLAGKSGFEIEELVKGYPQIAEIEIIITPAFLFDKVPQMTRRIEVVVN